MINDINKKISEILKEIVKSHSSLNEFAKKCNISSAYISKLINLKYETPPSPDILKKISDNSKGLTTYMELMMICGYITSEDIEEKDNALKLYDSVRSLKINLESKINSTILTDEEKIVVDKYVDDNFNKVNFTNNTLKESKTIKKNMTKLKEIYKIPNIDNKKVYSYCMDKFLLKTSNLILFINDADIYKNYVSSEKFDLYENNTYSTSSHKFNTNNHYTNKIPVLGSIPAGIPIELIEDIIDYEDISDEMLKGGKQYFALKVKGTSMWPKYLDGDTIIVLKQDDCESGQDAIVMVNGDDGTFKRVIKKNNGITLEPINQQEYNSVSYSNEDIEKLPVRILGVVKEIRRSV